MPVCGHFSTLSVFRSALSDAAVAALAGLQQLTRWARFVPPPWFTGCFIQQPLWGGGARQISPYQIFRLFEEDPPEFSGAKIALPKIFGAISFIPYVFSYEPRKTTPNFSS